MRNSIKCPVCAMRKFRAISHAKFRAISHAKFRAISHARFRTRDFARETSRDFAREISRDFAREISRDFARAISHARFRTRDFARAISHAKFRAISQGQIDVPKWTQAAGTCCLFGAALVLFGAVRCCSLQVARDVGPREHVVSAEPGGCGEASAAGLRERVQDG
eukprot:COSAG06_NODE_1147_length_10512_cov_5.815615_4_plen_165_part_00